MKDCLGECNRPSEESDRFSLVMSSENYLMFGNRGTVILYQLFQLKQLVSIDSDGRWNVIFSDYISHTKKNY